MKGFWKFLCYLPVIFLAAIGAVVVLDMSRIALVGRKPVTIAKKKTEEPSASATRSAGGDESGPVER
jgi:hypothetical protein